MNNGAQSQEQIEFYLDDVLDELDVRAEGRARSGYAHGNRYSSNTTTHIQDLSQAGKRGAFRMRFTRLFQAS